MQVDRYTYRGSMLVVDPQGPLVRFEDYEALDVRHTAAAMEYAAQLEAMARSHDTELAAAETGRSTAVAALQKQAAEVSGLSSQLAAFQAEIKLALEELAALRAQVRETRLLPT